LQTIWRKSFIMNPTYKMPLAGGTVEISMYGVLDPIARDYAELIHAEGQRLQRIFDFFSPESELSRLNKARNLSVSDELLAVVKKAIGYSRETGGKYDITLGRQFQARKKGLDLPAVSCSFRNVEIDGNTITLTHPDALLDLGSIAKGFIGDEIVEYMNGLGIESGFVDARGDLRAYGRYREVVSIKHPRKEGFIFRPIEIQNHAVATSGDYCQYHGTFETSHIIGDADFASVTVVAESLADADALATCVFVQGTQGAGRLLASHPEVKVFAIDKNMNWHLYNDFQRLALKGAGNGY
jgi:thiamine biosynthesis lipoprotein